MKDADREKTNSVKSVNDAKTSVWPLVWSHVPLPPPREQILSEHTWRLMIVSEFVSSVVPELVLVILIWMYAALPSYSSRTFYGPYTKPATLTWSGL